MLIGVLSAMNGDPFGAWIMLGAVCGFVLMHLSVGLVFYRRTMNRPWPKVPPLVDDDDDY